MITSSYEPIVGGTETVVKNLAIQLNKKGIKTDVLTINMDELWKPNRIWQIDDANGFKVYRAPAFNPFNLINNKLPNLLGLFLRIYVIPTSGLKKLMDKYDILHFHGEIDISLFLFSYSTKKPKIFHYHSIQIYKKNDLGTNVFRLNPVYKRIFNKCVNVHICNSKPGLDFLIKLGIDKKCIRILPNSVDAERFLIHTTDDPGNQTKRILCLGRLISAKLDTVVNTINAMPLIVKRIPNSQLIIVGGGPKYDYVKKLSIDMNYRLGNPNAILMTDKISSTDVNRILNSSDIVVGVGQVPLEAMASGKPAIVAGHSTGNEGGNFGDVVTKDNVLELLDYNFSGRNSAIKTTPEKIANSVLKLLCDDDYRLSVGKFGREFIDNELSVDRIADKLCLIYNDLISGNEIDQRSLR